MEEVLTLGGASLRSKQKVSDIDLLDVCHIKLSDISHDVAPLGIVNYYTGSPSYNLGKVSATIIRKLFDRVVHSLHNFQLFSLCEFGKQLQK